MVTSVPWQLASSAGARGAAEGTAPGACAAGDGRGAAVGGAVLSSGRRGATRRSDVVELDVGPVAHGGHCVARHEGRVVFVRHALPGERVRAVGHRGHAKSSFLRADAVEVLRPSPDRVEPPCPYAGPGRCGGCDLQHASLAAQRGLKADVVARAAAPARRASSVDVDGRAGAGRRRRARLAHPGALRGRRRRAGRPAPAPLARGRAGRPLPDRPPDWSSRRGGAPSGAGRRSRSVEVVGVGGDRRGRGADRARAVGRRAGRRQPSPSGSASAPSG